MAVKSIPSAHLPIARRCPPGARAMHLPIILALVPALASCLDSTTRDIPRVALSVDGPNASAALPPGDDRELIVRVTNTGSAPLVHVHVVGSIRFRDRPEAPEGIRFEPTPVAGKSGAESGPPDWIEGRQSQEYRFRLRVARTGTPIDTFQVGFTVIARRGAGLRGELETVATKPRSIRIRGITNTRIASAPSAAPTSPPLHGTLENGATTSRGRRAPRSLAAITAGLSL